MRHDWLFSIPEYVGGGVAKHYHSGFTGINYVAMFLCTAAGDDIEFKVVVYYNPSSTSNVKKIVPLKLGLLTKSR